jgi:tRNA nucleotidyltransferase (CCA-adding enzyme)
MIRVAAAIIRREGHILICRRKEGGSCSRLWEFPGGKIEPGESPADCAVRECMEELGISLQTGEEYARVRHQYPDREVEITFLWGEIRSGEPELRVHEEMAWVLPSALAEYPFCPADAGIIARLASQGESPREEGGAAHRDGLYGFQKEEGACQRE